MSVSSVSAVSAVKALLLSPIPASGHASNNLASTEEVQVDLAAARVARLREATSARRGTFMVDLRPDRIAQSQRFAATSLEDQSLRRSAS